MSDARMSPDRGTPLRMAVLFGGASTEHTISVRSARAVLAAADPARIAAVPVAIGRDGSWHDAAASRALVAAMDRSAPECVPAAAGSRGGLLAAPAALSALAEVDLAFPLVHGRTGEDGSLQGLLELCGLPYVGAGVAASAIGLDKTRMKAAFAAAGLPLPRTQVVTATAWASDRENIERALAAMPAPLFAKAANSGSSVGVVKIHDREAIGPGVDEALRFDRKVVVEEGIEGRELECAVLERPASQGGGAEATPPGEICTGRDFYDYVAKYEDPETELIVRADVAPAVAERARALAVAAFEAIDCAGFARVDFFLRGEDELFVNEINTLPGFTSASMFPRLWEAAGLSFPALIERLARLALERAEGRRADA
ncbi:MAG: D-alanine--D-alanine ligase [Chloroflexi bacterium]|nr:D-alanine--D-alanine ligase [Chloroflexota bacterium]